MIQEDHASGTVSRENDTKVIAGTIRSNRKKWFFQFHLVNILQVALKIVPRAMEGPRPQFFDFLTLDRAKTQIKHRKETQDNIFLRSRAIIQKKRIGIRMTAVILKQELPVFGW